MAASESQPPIRSTIPFRGLLLGCGLLALAAAGAARAQETRFSQSLTPADQAAAGLQKLSPDQFAVLDALVRRDEKITAAPDSGPPPPARFSQRLLPEERQSTGLALLTAAETARVDAAVARFESRGGSIEAPAGSIAGWHSAIQNPGLEVHGMLSFTYAAGRGGASAMGGTMAVSVADPAHGIALLAAYSEAHGKGPLLGRGCYGGFFPGYPLGLDPYLQP